MEYYISINNEKRGPYNLNELAERGIDATTLVMPTDSEQWTPAWQIEELRNVLMGKETQQVVAEKPIAEPQKEEEEPAVGKPVNDMPYVEAQPITSPPYTAPEPKKSHWGCLTAFIVSVVVVLALLVFTCPDTQDHKDALSDVITATVNEEVQQTTDSIHDDLLGKAFQAISKAFTGKVIDAAVDNLITVDNYFFFSVGKVHYANQDKVVSVGALKHIFTTDKNTLKKAAEKYYNEAELKVEADLRKQAEDALRENVINPATDAIKGMMGSAINGLLDDLGLGSGNNSDAEVDMEIDSI